MSLCMKNPGPSTLDPQDYYWVLYLSNRPIVHSSHLCCRHPQCRLSSLVHVLQSFCHFSGQATITYYHACYHSGLLPSLLFTLPIYFPQALCLNPPGSLPQETVLPLTVKLLPLKHTEASQPHGGLLLPAPLPAFDSTGLEWGPKVYISNKFSEMLARKHLVT
jgi:hypothetical protein